VLAAPTTLAGLEIERALAKRSSCSCCAANAEPLDAPAPPSTGEGEAIGEA
jgi:hypothetical protein